MQSLLLLRELYYRMGLKTPYRLRSLTISVGNLSVGGTGKSPLVQALVDWQLAQGKTPLVLSRGYGRESKETIFLGPGEMPNSVAQVGDEPMMLKQNSPACALLVDKQRARRAFERNDEFPLTILDDGFQHWQCYRDLDIVLWDASESRDQKLLPFGRLREKFSALARADIVVLTRVDEVTAEELGHCLTDLQQQLNEARKFAFHPRPWRPARRLEAWPPPIFLSRHRPKVADVQGMKGKKVVLLSGIGRPRSFRRSLETVGADILDTLEFPDHHQFTARDLERVRLRLRDLGQPLLVTTEKDFCRSWEQLSQFPNLQVWKIGLEFVQNSYGEFFRAIEERLQWARS